MSYNFLYTGDVFIEFPPTSGGDSPAQYIKVSLVHNGRLYRGILDNVSGAAVKGSAYADLLELKEEYAALYKRCLESSLASKAQLEAVNAVLGADNEPQGGSL